MSFFRLDRATASYNGRAVLHEISLEIQPGEKVSLIGASGAGKSTLLGLLYRQRPEDTALVTQDPSLVKTLSVFHNTYIGRLDRNPTWYNLANLVWPLPKELRGIGALLDSLGLADKLHTPAGELSGGQQQRTAVARALYRESAALLADEPVSAVDITQAHAVLEQIVARHETVVLAMHDVALALRYTGRVVGLRNGRVEFDRSSAGLDPADLLPIYQA